MFMVKDDHPSRFVGILSNKLRREIDSLSFRGQYSGTEGKALHFILAHEDSVLFQKDLEEEFGLRAPSASALVKKMEQDGLITRVPVSFDGRFKQIVPSEKAQQHREKVLCDVQELENRLLRGVSEHDLSIWLEVTKKMIENL
jgi:DNA-binding MarR family transcriptional regulator